MYKNQRIMFRIMAALFCVITLGTVAHPATAANQEGVTINAGAANTKTRDVTLTIHKTFAASHMRISNNESFTGAFWESVQSEKKWTLDVGAGNKTVYIQFKNRLEAESAVFRDSITLSIPAAMNVSFTINGNARETSSRYVNLSFSYSDGVEAVAIHNSENLAGALFTKIQSPMQWILSENSGTKTVYVMFRNVNGTTKTVQQSIVYNEPAGSFPPETLLKGDTDTVYYLGYDGRIHPFLHSIVYHSYYPSFAGIRYVSNRKLREYIIGEPVCLRPGTWLVKFKSLPRVYAVEP
ncbi:MAG: hypothetical protein KBD15_02955, partial [Candidatus Magasanikbacteria bacterium]|nr:hypothetical protein [Candidatus Magasanikbacteria bacterium]